MTTIIAIIILPMILAATLSYSQIINLFKSNVKYSLFFLSGFVIYFTIHFKHALSKKVSYAYILSHEMTHAIFGLLTGNKVKKINVGSKSGYVRFQGKVNIVTAISPYIFPFYNIVVTFTYLLFVYFLKINIFDIFLLIQGFSLSFHIMNTIDAISSNQKDFKESGGRFASSVLIILANMFITAILINLLISDDRQIIYGFIKNCLDYYVLIIKKILGFIYFILLSLKEMIK